MIQSIFSSFNSYGGYQNNSIGQTFLGILGYTFCCSIPWAIFAVMFLWLRTIRNSRHEGNIFLGLRQSFYQMSNSRSFNTDDVLMTLKSVLPLILSSIIEVFGKYGLSVNSLDEFATTIQTINNIQNVYGTGNAVAGAGGQANVSR
jgi:hypothetical protein